MPPRDFGLPDDFPDLSLPEAPQKTPEPLRPVAQPPQYSWKTGDRVLAPWEPQFLYSGKIAEIKGERALIEFEDGDAGWVLLSQIRALAVQQRQKVLSRRKMGHAHFPAEILEVRGDQVLVVFADSHDQEWTRIAALRIPCQPFGQGAEPAKFASHLAFRNNLGPGTRVWAPWTNDTLFAGTIDEIRGEEAHIHFDDGDRGWVLFEQLAPLDLPVGLLVCGRKKMSNQYFPARIIAADGNRVHIQYDAGGAEWTTTAALLIPCPPIGPAARPTSTGARWNASWGWIITVGVIVLLALARYGCR